MEVGGRNNEWVVGAASVCRTRHGAYPLHITYKLPIGPLGDHRGMKIAGLFLAVQRTVRGAEVGYPLVL
jgi:hypothetical protein